LSRHQKRIEFGRSFAELPLDQALWPCMLIDGAGRLGVGREGKEKWWVIGDLDSNKHVFL